jgi:hypothetical protein
MTIGSSRRNRRLGENLLFLSLAGHPLVYSDELNLAHFLYNSEFYYNTRQARAIEQNSLDVCIHIGQRLIVTKGTEREKEAGERNERGGFVTQKATFWPDFQNTAPPN